MVQGRQGAFSVLPAPPHQCLLGIHEIDGGGSRPSLEVRETSFLLPLSAVEGRPATYTSRPPPDDGESCDITGVYNR